MQRNLTNNNPLWRGLVGCAVAYALIINALLAGVVGAQWAAQASSGLTAEHCLTTARADERPSAPQPGDCARCELCILTMSAPAVLPQAPCALAFTFARERAPHGLSERAGVDEPDHPGKLPRGPPRQA